MQKIFALREGVAFRLSYAKIKAWQALDFNMLIYFTKTASQRIEGEKEGAKVERDSSERE